MQPSKPPPPLHPLVRWLSEHGRPILLRTLSRDSCIESTAAAVDFLRAHGISCRELPVLAMVFNQAGWRLYRSGVLAPRVSPEDADLWDAVDAWSVGIGYTEGLPGPGRYGGHLVALVEDRWLLDLSLDQASRPRKGIVIEAPVLALLDPAGSTRRQVFTEPGGLVISYEPNLQPWASSYRRSRGWRARHQRRAFAAELEAAHIACACADREG